MKSIKKWDKIDEALNRGVDTIYPSKQALEKVLRSGKKIKLYLGVDPTGEDLHIGHAVPLNKLRQFQELGHNVILLIGDFTGMIGDPAGKSQTRAALTRKQVLGNAKYYKKQAGKILDFNSKNPITVKYNSNWLSKLSNLDFFNIAAQLTVPQLLKRDLFKQRIKQGNNIYLHEFLYPVMQGYDSVAMDIDLEIGGSDQMFNMMVGRDLMKKIKNKEKFVLTLPLITDPQGNKIGKTEGNVIAISGKPEELFGQIMSLPDSAIIPCFEIITDMPMIDVANMKKQLEKKTANPMYLKKKLAWTLVKQYNNKKSADNAQQAFEKKYQPASRRSRGDVKRLSEAAEKISVPHKTSLVNLIIQQKAVDSRAKAKRLILQGAVKINGKNIIDINYNYKPEKDDIIEIGKHKVYKVKLNFEFC